MAMANPSPLMSNLIGSGGRDGPDRYRGEGGLASAGDYHSAIEPFLGPPTKRIGDPRIDALPPCTLTSVSDAEPHHRFPHEAW